MSMKRRRSMKPATTIFARQKKKKSLLLQRGTEWHPSVLESCNECAWEAFIDAIAHYAIQVLLNGGGEKALQNGTSALTSGCSGESDNGNGSLMRILPMAIYVKYKMPKASMKDTSERSENNGRYNYPDSPHSKRRQIASDGIRKETRLFRVSNHPLSD